jgi:hypothetical protein
MVTDEARESVVLNGTYMSFGEYDAQYGERHAG